MARGRSGLGSPQEPALMQQDHLRSVCAASHAGRPASRLTPPDSRVRELVLAHPTAKETELQTSNSRCPGAKLP